jgi:iron only hydrogenase large subunit-like protein
MKSSTSGWKESIKLILREETDMILTERELTLIIEELEVDEEIYEQMIREEREKGNEPEPRHLEVLNLLNKLRSVRV